MYAHITFDCCINPKQKHRVVIDLRRYPDVRLVRGDIKIPVFDGLHPCRRFFTEPYWFTYEHNDYDLDGLLYYWLVDPNQPLPQKGILWFLHKFFYETEGWPNPNHRDEKQYQKHTIFARKLLQPKPTSVDRVRFLIENNYLSSNHAFVRIANELSPQLTARYSIQKLIHEMENTGDLNRIALPTAHMLEAIQNNPHIHRLMPKLFRHVDIIETYTNTNTRSFDPLPSYVYRALCLAAESLNPHIAQRAQQILRHLLETLETHIKTTTPPISPSQLKQQITEHFCLHSLRPNPINPDHAYQYLKRLAYNDTP